MSQEAIDKLKLLETLLETHENLLDAIQQATDAVFPDDSFLVHDSVLYRVIEQTDKPHQLLCRDEDGEDLLVSIHLQSCFPVVMNVGGQIWVGQPTTCDNGIYRFRGGYTNADTEACYGASSDEFAKRCASTYGDGRLIMDGQDLWWDPVVSLHDQILPAGE